MKLAVWLYMHILERHLKRHPRGGSIWCPRWLQGAVFAELARRGAVQSPVDMGEPNMLYWAKPPEER